MKKEIVYIIEMRTSKGWIYWMTFDVLGNARGYKKVSEDPQFCRIIKQTTTTRVERKVVK